MEIQDLQVAMLDTEEIRTSKKIYAICKSYELEGNSENK